jgi:hypothetical protein
MTIDELYKMMDRALGIPDSPERRQVRLGRKIVGRHVKFRHQLDQPHQHRVRSVCVDGMVELDDLAGEFAPDLLVVVDHSDIA